MNTKEWQELRKQFNKIMKANLKISRSKLDPIYQCLPYRKFRYESNFLQPNPLARFGSTRHTVGGGFPSRQIFEACQITWVQIMVTNFDDSHNFVQTLSFIFNYTDDHWVISEPDLTDLSSYPSKEIKGEKSIGQIACEAAIKKIEREKGIKLMYECIKNDNVKPLPEPFNKFLNGGIDHASPLEFQIHLLLKVFRAKRDFKLAKYAENLLSDLARSRVETEARGEVFDYNSAYRNYQKHQAKIK